jgi:hypothetical protein
MLLKSWKTLNISRILFLLIAVLEKSCAYSKGQGYWENTW